MKNQKIIWSVIAVIVIIVIVIFVSRGSGSNNPAAGTTPATGSTATTGSNAATPSPAVTTPVGQVVTVSASTKNYQNLELGFSVDYPSTWGLQDADSGPTFTIPNGGNTGIYTLQAQIYFVSGACAFPPVASSTIVGQSTLVAGSHSYKMIKVATTAQSKSYLDEMYTLQQGTTAAPSCYVFSFASTVTSPVSAATQTTLNSATKAFTAMVQSFAIVTGPAGQSETAHPSGK